jgi:hypothetical protein
MLPGRSDARVPGSLFRIDFASLFFVRSRRDRFQRLSMMAPQIFMQRFASGVFEQRA